MTVTTEKDASLNLGRLCNQAVEDREPVLVKLDSGAEVVIVASEEYESLSETAHLLASPENATRLLAALASARRGDTPPMSLEDLRAAVGL